MTAEWSWHAIQMPKARHKSSVTTCDMLKLLRECHFCNLLFAPFKMSTLLAYFCIASRKLNCALLVFEILSSSAHCHHLRRLSGASIPKHILQVSKDRGAHVSACCGGQYQTCKHSSNMWFLWLSRTVRLGRHYLSMMRESCLPLPDLVDIFMKGITTLSKRF